MNNSNQLKSIFIGPLLILIGNLIIKGSWRVTLVNSIVYILGALLIPRLITLLNISDRIQTILYGGFYILVGNLVWQDDWGITLFAALIFVIGGLVLPPLVTFMSDADEVNR